MPFAPKLLVESDMKNLRKYVEQANWFRSLFDKLPLIDVANIDETTAAYLFKRLECDLSPENLTCDGEFRGAKLRAKAAMLHGAKADLLKLGFKEPAYW
jgi:hypothetical protein